ncbi:MAG: FtsX-like permease family protein [Promicromonosporaceae bacterium]|nr:FtsX-like permease family protein [Promicromonosporaceae bacterium]
MRRVALRGIRAHMVRSVMSLVAVALGVAFIAGTMSLRTMLSDTFDSIVDVSIAGDAYVRGVEEAVIAADFAGVPARNLIDLSLGERLAAVDGVRHVAPGAEGPVALIGADGTVVASGVGAPSLALGVDAVSAWGGVAAGRMPATPQEIALEATTLASSGLAIGDTTTVLIGGQAAEMTLVGELVPAGPMAGATVVIIYQPLALELFAADGMTGSFEILAEAGVSPAELAARIAPVLEGVYPPAQVVTGEYLREINREAIGEQLGFITVFLMLFAGIAMFVGGFIIANTFAMSVQQRTREFALLRAIGAAPRQVFTSVLLQAGAVGVIGSGLGVALGFGLSALIRVGLAAMGMGLADNIPFTAETVITAMVVGTVVSVVAAAIPARRAALVPPIEAMRADGSAAGRSLIRRAVFGGLLTALGGAALVATVIWPHAEAANLTLTAGVLGTLIGALVLMPVLAGRVLRVLAVPAVALVRPMGRLARGNVTRNPRRTASTAGALMIGAALVATVSVMAASMNESLTGAVRQEAQADFIMQSPMFLGRMPEGAVAAVAALPEVERVAPVGMTRAGVGHHSFDEPIGTMVAGVEAGLLGRFLFPPMEQGVFGATGDLGPGEALVQNTEFRNHGLALGDTLTVAGRKGEVEVTIVGVFGGAMFNLPLIVAQETLDAIAPTQDQMSDLALVAAVSGADLADLEDALNAAVEPFMVVTVMDRDAFIDFLAGQVQQVMTVLFALLALSIIIAVLGVVNTLALSVIERTKEIGLLRAVGLGRFQLSSTVVIESILTAVFGTLLGLAVGVAVAATLPAAMAGMGLTTLAIPFGGLAVILGLAVIVGLLAAVWPAIRAARLPVLDAISHA